MKIIIIILVVEWVEFCIGGEKSLMSGVLAEALSVGFEERGLYGGSCWGLGRGWECELYSCVWGNVLLELGLGDQLR